MSSARGRRFRYPKPISTPPGTTGRLRSSLSIICRRCLEEEEEEEEEEEGLFKADAVNEEDPERDRATPA